MKEAGEEGNNVADENIVQPDVLYKYREFDTHTERIFTHSEIYFPSPDSFTDPFDSKPHLTCDGTKMEIKRYLRERYRKKHPKLRKQAILTGVEMEIRRQGSAKSVLEGTFEEARDRFRKILGICCFTEIRDHILMWSHYAKGHTGFCLEFDAKNDFFRPRVLKVEYNKFRPELNVMKLDSYREGELARAFLIKAKDWKYEHEWRIVDGVKGVKDSRTQKFPEEALIGVILGCRISEENKDNEENVLKWCRERKHRPTLYRAKEKEFGLKIDRIKNY